MKNVSIFIDGFNIYYAINNKRLKKYKWLDLNNLTHHFISKNTQQIKDIYYFTALAKWSQKKVDKHNVYLRALRKSNVKIIKGEFRKKDKFCFHCKKTTKTYEEKETDVNIAIKLVSLAFKNQYDTAMILSGDSDLCPAIKEVKKYFPEKDIILIIPPFRKAEMLKRVADRHIKLTEPLLRQYQFPDKIICKSGSIIHKPDDWK